MSRHIMFSVLNGGLMYAPLLFCMNCMHADSYQLKLCNGMQVFQVSFLRLSGVRWCSVVFELKINVFGVPLRRRFFSPHHRPNSPPTNSMQRQLGVLVAVDGSRLRTRVVERKNKKLGNHRATNRPMQLCEQELRTMSRARDFI